MIVSATAAREQSEQEKQVSLFLFVCLFEPVLRFSINRNLLH